MHPLRDHVRPIVACIGVLSCVAVSFWGDSADDGPSYPLHASDHAGIVLVFGFQLSPFLALAGARRLSPWVSLPAALAFGALLRDAQHEVAHSTSSTAPVLIFFAPLMLLMAVPLLVACSETARLVRRHLAGGATTRPGRWHAVLALVAGALGLVILGLLGFAAGLALAFAIWAAENGDPDDIC
jgi:hypothetical protein